MMNQFVQLAVCTSLTLLFFFLSCSGVGSQVPSADGGGSADDMNMCAFRDAIANALVGDSLLET